MDRRNHEGISEKGSGIRRDTGEPEAGPYGSLAEGKHRKEQEGSHGQ